MLSIWYVPYCIVCWTVGKTEEFFDEQLAALEVNSWSMNAQQLVHPTMIQEQLAHVLDDTMLFYAIHEFSGCLGQSLQF